MRSRVLAVLLLSACLLYSQQPAPLETSGSGRIEGVTLHAITGEPVRRVNLTLNFSAREPVTRTAASDADGRFSFDGLAPGVYMLRAERTGFVWQSYTGTPGSSSAPPLRLTQGQVIRDIVLKLVPQGVIVGKVLDDEGEPVSRAVVISPQPRHGT